MRLRRLRNRVKLVLLELTYGRVWLSADFIYHPMGTRAARDPLSTYDPLYDYWTLGWKLSLMEYGRPYQQYGSVVK